MRLFSSTVPISVAALTFAAMAAPTADASPRFSVTNETDAKINLYIFTGDDPFCTFEEKLKTVSAGETDSYGCTGNGKGQCKVQFYKGGDEICKTDRNTCSKNATKAKGGSSITIALQDDEYVCSF